MGAGDERHGGVKTRGEATDVIYEENRVGGWKQKKGCEGWRERKRVREQEVQEEEG